MALDPDSLAGKYTNVSENLALLRQHSHEIMIEIASELIVACFVWGVCIPSLLHARL
jgi:hypothetical protein